MVTSFTFKSDICSLMLILYGMFKLKQDKYGSAHFLSSNDINIIKNRLKDMESEHSKKDFIAVFPAELKGLASRAISPHQASRPDLQELKMNAWFQDELVKGIYYMENFYNLPESNKNVFLASLAKMICKYSQDIVEKRFIPFITTNMIHSNLLYNLTLIVLVIVDKKLIHEEDKMRY